MEVGSLAAPLDLVGAESIEPAAGTVTAPFVVSTPLVRCRIVCTVSGAAVVAPALFATVSVPRSPPGTTMPLELPPTTSDDVASAAR